MLAQWDAPQYLVRWLNDNLKSRKCHVGDQMYGMKNGVPQGSVLGPLLFQIYVSRVLTNLGHGIFSQAYADDFVVACSAQDVKEAEYVLNEALSRIDARCKHIGIELDPMKAKPMWMRKAGTRQKFPKL